MSDCQEDALYCICQRPYDEAVFMIECDVCKDWFHGDCVSIEEHQAGDIEIYHCPSCQGAHGPLKLRKKRSRKRCVLEYSDDLDDLHDVACGTVSFVKALKQKTFVSADKILKKMRGHQLDKEYIENNGFSVPIMVKDAAGLDLKVPSAEFTVYDVELAVGSMREVDVIDVAKQSDMKMLMREFVEYYNSPNRARILNVISLEFSNTRLSEMVTPPRIINELSWVSNYWPESTGDVRTFIRPEVQKYCLMSVKDSYTDFHIDFGGTSVWYHVIKGSKVFYLIEPSDSNLALYETWASSSDQNAIFFGDQVNACYKAVVKPGQTLFIPTGWIHGVFTPEDSLVFGGNFIHSYAIKLQLDVYEMEKRIGTPDKFSFPNLETLYWYAAKNLTDRLQEALDGGREPCKFVVDGCVALRQRLHAWMKEKEQMVKRHRDYIPEGISHTKLLKEFAHLISQITLKLSPTKSPKRVAVSVSPKKYTHLKKKKQAPLKVKAKKKRPRLSLDSSEQTSANKVKPEANQDRDGDTDQLPEQKELRQEKSTCQAETSTASDTDFSVTSDRATLLGLKFKLNRTQASIKSEPEPTQVSTQSSEDGNSDDADNNVVVDDPPSKPTEAVETIKKYRFSLGGRNIKDLTSTSEEVLSSDTTRSPEKLTHNAPSSTQRTVAWSKGIENLIKATATRPNHTDSKDIKVPVSTILTPGVQRKERLGTKLTRPIATAFISAPSKIERDRLTPPSNQPSSSSDSPPAADPGQEEDDAMEKRLKSCYADDTYVYPALEDSDYDEEEVTRPLKKRKRLLKDNSWLPTSSAGRRAQPIRDKRPSREHAVKPSVKAELEMAREYLKAKPSHKAKRSYIKKGNANPPNTASGHTESHHQSSDSDSLSSSPGLTVNIPSTSMDHGYHLPPRSPVDTGSKPKQRRSGSTTKQRLGKLLKLF